MPSKARGCPALRSYAVASIVGMSKSIPHQRDRKRLAIRTHECENNDCKNCAHTIKDGRVTYECTHSCHGAQLKLSIPHSLGVAA
jgi:hypothetical protein